MQSTTNDNVIRELLIPFVRGEHSTAPDTIYFGEFALYGGAVRADYAALNGLSHGYEIKSDRDSLIRLPQQVEAYSAVFERATLVSAGRHLAPAQGIIPEWWGIIEVRAAPTCDPHLERVRESKPNPRPSSAAIASLLWRPEALQILERLGLDNGVRSKPMEYLIDRLALTIGPEKLSQYVREALRARGDWRAAARLRRCDGTCPRPSNRSDFQRISSENTGQ